MEISGKTAIITGAASGIGLGIAAVLAEAEDCVGKLHIACNYKPAAIRWFPDPASAATSRTGARSSARFR